MKALTAIADAAEALGGLFLLAFETFRAAFRGKLDSFLLWRTLYDVGVRSLPIVLTTATFAGAIAATQAGTYVIKFGAYEMVGWGFGWGTFRELGPLLIGLMFSGRVGAHNTAELGSMKVTEQIDALRALAIDPVEYLVLPRFIAMVVMMSLLNVLGNVCSILGGLVVSYVLIQVDPFVFLNSFITYVKLSDFFSGFSKATFFGACIALISCSIGLSVQGGAPGVGRAVTSSVVASAIGIFVLDYLITWIGG